MPLSREGSKPLAGGDGSRAPRRPGRPRTRTGVARARRASARRLKASQAARRTSLVVLGSAGKEGGTRGLWPGDRAGRRIAGRNRDPAASRPVRVVTGWGWAARGSRRRRGVGLVRVIEVTEPMRVPDSRLPLLSVVVEAEDVRVSEGPVVVSFRVVVPDVALMRLRGLTVQEVAVAKVMLCAGLTA